LNWVSILITLCLFLLAQIGLIYLLGVWTLVIYRHGGLHRWHKKTVNLNGWRAFVLDHGFAWVTTFCGCMTQPIVYTYYQADQQQRALRFLAWCSLCRLTLVICLTLVVALQSASFHGGWIFGVFLTVVSIWGSWMKTFIVYNSSMPLFTPSSMFVCRESVEPLSLAPRDAARETIDMLKIYGGYLVFFSAIGSILWNAGPSAILVGSIHPIIWPLVGGLMGILIPADLIALTPIIVALSYLGVPVSGLLPFMIASECTAKRTYSVIFDYLQHQHHSIYRRGTWVLIAWFVAICMSFPA
jgi:hypothetical protein